MVENRASSNKPAASYIVRTLDGSGRIINETAPCNYQGAADLLDIKKRANPAMRYELLNIDGSPVSTDARALEEYIESHKRQKATGAAFDEEAYNRERNRRNDLWNRFRLGNSVGGMVPVTVVGNDKQTYGMVYVEAGYGPVESVEFEVSPERQSITQYLRAFRERDAINQQVLLTAQRKRWPVAWDETANANALSLTMGKASLWSALRHLGFVRGDAFPIARADDLSVIELRILERIRRNRSVVSQPLDEMALAALLKEGLASRSERAPQQMMLTAKGAEFLKMRDEWD